MGLLLYIIFALIFGAIGFGASEFLHKKKTAAAGPNAGPGPSPTKSGKGAKGGKSAKTRSAETALSGTSSKKGKKK